MTIEDIAQPPEPIKAETIILLTNQRAKAVNRLTEVGRPCKQQSCTISRVSCLYRGGTAKQCSYHMLERAVARLETELTELA